MAYIYKIINKINNKIYIGKTTQSIEDRFNQHKNKSKKLNTHLYNAIRKYGISHFQIKIVEECDSLQLDEKEKYWIKYYNSTNPKIGYNMTLGGEGGNTWETNPHKLTTGEKIRYSILKNNYIPITKESLYQDMNNELTYQEMMNKYHCSSVTLTERFRYFFNGKSLKELRHAKNSGQFKPILFSEQNFIQDIKKGILTNEEIQKKYNMSETSLFNKCKELTGLTPNKIRVKPIIKQGAPKINVEKEKLLEQIKQNKNLIEIAEYFNVSKQTIRRRIKEYFNSTLTEVRKNVR